MSGKAHLNVETISLYLNATKAAAKGGWDESKTKAIEEHLLICPNCVDLAEEELMLGSLIRKALILQAPSLDRRRVA